MWCMFPFFEVNAHDKDLYEFAFHHYFDELKSVLQTFNSNLKSFGLPEEYHEFRSLLRRGFVLEFLIVTVLRPVLNINNPEEVLKWYKNLLKYEEKKAKGGIHALLARKKPKLPPQESVFQNPKYLEFLQFYFKVATALGAFQELGLIYFELMKDGLFKNTTTVAAVKPKKFTMPWFKSIFSCVGGVNEKDDMEDDDIEYNFKDQDEIFTEVADVKDNEEVVEETEEEEVEDTVDHALKILETIKSKEEVREKNMKEVGGGGR